MTIWTEMQPAEFDTALATPKAREVIRTAQATLFPRLLPAPASRKRPAQREPMPGEQPLFSLGSGT